MPIVTSLLNMLFDLVFSHLSFDITDKILKMVTYSYTELWSFKFMKLDVCVTVSKSGFVKFKLNFVVKINYTV